MPRSPALEPPPGNLRFPAADGLRGIAILCVIFCHSTGFSGAMANASWDWVALYLGTVAVAVFLALSGFLLYRPFASGHAGLRRAPSVRAYGRRRVLRIVPGYWVALTLLAVWPGISGVFSGDWWVYYGFAQVYSMQTIQHGIPIAWTVCTEVSFYLLLPLLAAAAARLAAPLGRRSWWRAEAAVLIPFGLAGGFGRALVFVGDLPSWTANTLMSWSACFAVGMGLAVASVEFERARRVPRAVNAVFGRAWVSWLGAGAALLVAYNALDIFELRVHPLRALPFGVVLGNSYLFAVSAGLALFPIVVGRGGAIRRLLTSRWVAFLGVISYGMYLWHMPLEAWLAGYRYDPLPVGGPGIQHLIGGPVTLTLMVATVVCAGLAGAASYYVVELPFLRRKELPLLRRRPAAPASAVATASTQPESIA